MSEVLAIEVGNSRAKFGVFRYSNGQRLERIAHTAVALNVSVDLGGSLLSWLTQNSLRPEDSIVAGSNPPLRDQLLAAWPDLVPSPRVICKASEIPVELDVDSSTVGLDRLLTAYAAIRSFAPGQPVITVDSGTATTISLITGDEVFRGGAILPGLRLSARALHDYTARLPLLDTDQIADRVSEDVAPLPGRNTHEAMTAGLFWGQLGAIVEIRDRLVTAARTTYGEQGDLACLLTGGGGRQLCEHLSPCEYVDCLALHGLAELAVS